MAGRKEGKSGDQTEAPCSQLPAADAMFEYLQILNVPSFPPDAKQQPTGLKSTDHIWSS